MDRSAREKRGGARPSGVGSLRTGIVAAVVVVLTLMIVLALAGSLAAARYETYLGGLWVGDPGFLRRARLRDMQLFLAPREGGARQGYLIMTDLNGTFLANQAFELRVGSGAQRWWTALKSVFRTRDDAYTARRAEFEFDGAAPPIPARLEMTLSMLDGTLVLADREKVYAFLEKDAAASAAATEAYGP